MILMEFIIYGNSNFIFSLVPKHCWDIVYIRVNLSKGRDSKYLVEFF